MKPLALATTQAAPIMHPSRSSGLSTAVRAKRVGSVWLATALGSINVAGAQPVTRPDPLPCQVSIVVAPDNVRSEIEAWARLEPRCNKVLEVRVVPTDGGFYLMARDDQGHVRERVVPDAQSAAVLVVSWAADDSIGTTHPLSIAPAVTAPDATPVRPPGSIAPVAPSDDSVSLVAPPLELPTHPRHRALSFGGITMRHGFGARGQLDLIGRGAWTLGISGEWRKSFPDLGHGAMPTDGLLQSGKAVVHLGRTASFGRFALRAQIGVGAELGEVSTMMQGEPGVVLAPLAEVGLLGTLHLGGDWGLICGPIVDISARDHSEQASVVGFLGLQRGL